MVISIWKFSIKISCKFSQLIKYKHLLPFAGQGDHRAQVRGVGGQDRDLRPRLRHRRNHPVSGNENRRSQIRRNWIRIANDWRLFQRTYFSCFVIPTPSFYNEYFKLVCRLIILTERVNCNLDFYSKLRKVIILCEHCKQLNFET